MGVLCLNDRAEGAVAGTVVMDSSLGGVKWQSVAHDVRGLCPMGDFLPREGGTWTRGGSKL